jgi:peptidoglycan-N-acetylglucosamine deacetylase
MLVGLVATIALLVAALWVFWIEPLAVLGLLERLTPHFVYRVRTELPLVALSFDDGPHPEFTPQVLEILERYDAKATFFLIGERALRHPELVSRIRAAEHEVGNHYLRNCSVLLHSDSEFAGNLEKTEIALGISGGRKLFRPPGGVAWPRQLRLARARGYECVLGCAYPHDPMRPPVWYIKWLIGKNLRPGTIVILHDGISDPKRSIQALPQILSAGGEKGLRFVSIGELVREGQATASGGPSSSMP